MILKKICAWCLCDLDGISDPNAEISHGICEDCAGNHFNIKAERSSFQEFIDRFSAPLLVVDEDVVAMAANTSAQNLLGKAADKFAGFRGGEIMECLYARNPGGCGRDQHCKACAIRSAVEGTHSDGKPRERVECYQKVFVEKSAPLKMKLWVSTEKVGDFVLLRIDGSSKDGEAA